MARSTNVKRDRMQAERAIDVHEKITLSPADWDRFHDALIDPPAPNRKLKAAARRYRERFGE
jgi:uncharacterized protein (DUF1778 family)